MRRVSRRTKSGELVIPESKVQSAIITTLNRMRIKNNRVNGAQVSVTGKNQRGNASTRRIRCNSINGKADIETWPYIENEQGIKIGIPIYIEVKASTGGRQSEDQKTFEKDMKDRGYYYFVAKSVADAINGINDVCKDVEDKLPGFKMKIIKMKVT